MLLKHGEEALLPEALARLVAFPDLEALPLPTRNFAGNVEHQPFRLALLHHLPEDLFVKLLTRAAGRVPIDVCDGHRATSTPVTKVSLATESSPWQKSPSSHRPQPCSRSPTTRWHAASSDRWRLPGFPTFAPR